ncbi:ribosome maturation factor RimP [Gordonia polyisoprenivorans VH2]|uniref:Ribosome maturation factor RimP n=1 Tax=Gordonia polyisoprenivorans (strain DSM 44266 / VH2) TaxID=1112204 RepID=H6MYU5_GORPV|nr:ribosome maturation factor RimP [Gordonia polyisoprenivorans]AFA73086.1 ribosome maturation factor RimP [Gordonia polyisoprenivorans VH2]
MTIDRTRVRELVGEFVTDRGLDLEDVIVSTSAGTDEIRVIVDSDAGTDLDLLGELTRDISDALDTHDDLSDAPYTLEVTSPGVDRPLTLPRHWRRARGRKVAIRGVDGASIAGRIGALDDETVAIVVNHRGRIAVESVRLDAVDRAVVEVDFSRPSVAELTRCGLDDAEIARRRDPGTAEL